MSKRNKKAQNRCEEHVFQLKPLYNQSKIPEKTCVSFCEGVKSKKNKKTLQNHSSQCLSYPIYNKDHNHATPSFILQEDKCHYEEQGQRLRQQHDMKMGSYLQEKDSLNVPKPKSKTSHCNVCRQPYEDYLIHIQSQTHHEKSKHNIYTRFIEQLTHKFSNVNLKNKNTIYSSHHTLTTQGEDEKEIPQSLPKKKIKSDENQQNINQENRLQPPKALVQGNNHAQISVPGEQQNNVTNNSNFWYSPYFYPILYPYNYQLIYQNQLPPSCYYLNSNYPNPLYPNYNNFSTLGINQPIYLENQNPNIPLSIPQQFQFKNNLFLNQ